MGRIAPIALLLALAACSSSRNTANVPATPMPVQAAAIPTAQPPKVATASSSVQEVNELFRWLDGQPAAGVTASRVTGTTTAHPAVIYTIPRANPAMLAVVDGEAQQAAYRENLEGCLDGRFPAFCDHGALSGYDAARVREAEIQANVATCIDPAWQHLCRADLLPADGIGVTTAGASTPATVAPRAVPVLVTPAIQSPRLVTASPMPLGHIAATARPGSLARPPASSAPVARGEPTFPAPPPAITAPPIIVQETERQAETQPAAFPAPAPTWQPMPAPAIRYAPACSESGSCYGDISAITGRPKTTYVRGYFRRNGTYVRGYYRSRR